MGRFIPMDNKSWVVLEKNAIEIINDEVLELKNTMPNERDRWEMMGKSGFVPRIQKLFGEFPYSFSNHKMVPDPVTPRLVVRCLEYARAHFSKFEWNGALVNLYVDGADGIGMHSDDEPELNKEAPILSFSFGATRRFLVMANKNHSAAVKKRLTLDLEHGDLVVMGGNLQEGFKHSIPKTKKPVAWRLNITIRSLLEINRAKKPRLVEVEEE